MGFIRTAHGTITVEGRSESFTVHAGYGYEPGRRHLRDLALGTEFVASPDGPRRLWKVAVIAEEYVSGREQVSSVMHDFGPDELVEIPGYDVETDTALGRKWREVAHLEFEYADLDDLIAALVGLRDDRGAS